MKERYNDRNRCERKIKLFEDVSLLTLKMETRNAGGLFYSEAEKEKEVDSPLQLWN